MLVPRRTAPAYLQLARRGEAPWTGRYPGIYRPAEVAALLDQPMDVLALNAVHKVLFRVSVT